MNGNFTVQLLDILGYIIPGCIILLGLITLLPTKLLERLKAYQHFSVYVLLLFIFSFTLGIFVHISTASIHGAINKITGKRTLQSILDEMPETLMAEQAAKNRLNIKFSDKIDFYRYAETVVEEKMPKRGNRASRLIAFALFSKNLILACIFLASVVLLKIKSKCFKIKAFLFVVTLIAIVLLWRGYILYSKNSIQVTLRTFIVWNKIN